MSLHLLSAIFLSCLTFAVGAQEAQNMASNMTEPCGIITQQLLEFNNSSPDASKFPFDISLGYACLQSSTFDSGLATTFVDEMAKYLQFESTLAYLKNPPSSYEYPPIDIIGALNNVSATAASGGFKSQYEFDQAVLAVTTAAHEGHIEIPFCTTSSMQFVRNLSLVSVSSDGVQLPKLYVVENGNVEITATSGQGLSQSEVVAINGQNASAFVQSDALAWGLDLDASYNVELWNYGATFESTFPQGSFAIDGKNPGKWLGTSTNVTFANGTNQQFNNFAVIKPSVWNASIVDGSTFTDWFCIQPAQATTSTSSPSMTPSSQPSPTISGYPVWPKVIDPNQNLAGYYLNTSGYQDIAIMLVPSFATANSHAVTFQTAAAKFIKQARADNKTKIVIDLTFNGGGNTLLPYDLFKRFFPSEQPYGASRLRAGTAASTWAQSLGAIPSATFQKLVSAPNATDLPVAAIGDYDYLVWLDDQNAQFASASEYFPTNVFNGDNFSALSRHPINSVMIDELSDDVVPYGYGNNSFGSTVPPQPFSTENIVILTDGYCASSCTLFTTFMTTQGNVTTITIGGRPQNAPMQAMGGTRGAEAFAFSDLQAMSQYLSNSSFIPDDLLATANATFPGLNDLPLQAPGFFASATLNLRDQILPGQENTQVPSQFQFIPSDCRIFYTPESVFSPTEKWMQVADVMWGNKTCAYGSVSNNSSSSGQGPVPQLTNGATSASVALTPVLFFAVIIGGIIACI